ncbi:MAG: hypothetical protein AAFX87_24845 [Bacteroidota bacterium]
MLNFFRINDPYRLIGVFILLLAIRLPYLLDSSTLTLPEIEYMLVGEKMAHGSTLYVEVWNDTAPLSAVVFWLLHILFGKSHLAYQIVSLFLVFFQCLVFNRLLLVNKAYNENTYIPAVIYAVLASLAFDFSTLSPALMSMTFVILALNGIFNHLEFRMKKDEKIFNIGFYLGLAALFYLPFIVFTVMCFLVFILFTGTVRRRYFLMLYGVALPFLLLICYYILIDGLGDLNFSLFAPLFLYKGESYTSLQTFAVLSFVPLLFLILTIIKLNRRSRFTNYQVRLVQVMFVWLVLTLSIFLFSKERMPNVLIAFVPPLSFLTCHYFLLIRRQLLAEITFVLFIALVLFVNYGSSFKGTFIYNIVSFEDLMVSTDDKQPIVKDKKVLVLGDNIGLYQHNTLATPYLNWRMSQEVLSNLNYYDNQVRILESFKYDSPEVVYDLEGRFPNILERIPELESMYEKTDDNVFRLRSNN